MKNKIIFILFALILVLSSCKPKQHITQDTTNTSQEVIIQHDKLTPVALPVDSSHIIAKFECDSNFNVVLKELNEIKTRNIQSAFDWRDGFLDMRLKFGGDTVYIPGTDFYWKVNTTAKKTITITKTVKVEKQLSWMQKLLIGSARIFFVLLFITVLYFIVKLYYKYK